MSFLKNRKNVLFLFVVIALIIIVLFVYFNFKNTSYVYGDCVKYRSTEDLLSSSSSDHLIKFSSCNDLTAKLKEAYNEIEFYNYYGYSTNKPSLLEIPSSEISSGKVSSLGSVAATSEADNSYSTTNVPVQGA
ncbi:MAG: hypothetical protein N3E37_04760 [Candidatus Micrarchaeota archaeon]|nr:hypothetical protein [Candidatus Micrarchaeota archaeon]